MALFDLVAEQTASNKNSTMLLIIAAYNNGKMHNVNTEIKAVAKQQIYQGMNVKCQLKR